MCYNSMALGEKVIAVSRSYAGMAELADARDLKSCAMKIAYRFEPGFRHHFPFINIAG